MIDLKYYEEQINKMERKKQKKELNKYLRLEKCIKKALRKKKSVATLYTGLDTYDYTDILRTLRFDYNVIWNDVLNFFCDTPYIMIRYDKHSINNLNEKIKKSLD